jgi:hypothetical protein
MGGLQSVNSGGGSRSIFAGIDRREIYATPQQYSSGETQRLGRISKRGTGAMRSLLYEAAIVMLTRTKLWLKPKAWALKILRKKWMKKAAVALGRKLAVIMHRMLITKQAFRLGDPSCEPKNHVMVLRFLT